MEKRDQEGCFKMRIIEYHDYKTLMGPCFVSFSIPLLIPGVVLTVVGSYGNEHTFARFGAWHISGIVILSFAVVMLIAGILLKCCYRPIMSADIEQHLSPNPSMITGCKTLGHTDDPDDPDSAGAQRGNGNKVSPLHFHGKHTVVSTHDKTHKPNSSKNQKGSKGAHSINKHDQTNTKSSKNVPTAFKDTSKHDNERVKKEKRNKDIQDGIDTIPDKHRKHRDRNSDSDRDYQEKRSRQNKPETYPHPREPPPAYEEIGERQLRANNTGTRQGPPPPVGVGAMVDRSEGTAGSSLAPGQGGQRDLSSDGNENTRFLPEKKKRKKKKRVKRRQSDMSDMAEESSESPRTEFSELHLKPVLLHEGEPHQHNEHHVHFVPEQAGVDKYKPCDNEVGEVGQVKNGADEGAVGGAVVDDAVVPDKAEGEIATADKQYYGNKSRDKDDPEWYVRESPDSS